MFLSFFLREALRIHLPQFRGQVSVHPAASRHPLQLGGQVRHRCAGGVCVDLAGLACLPVVRDPGHGADPLQLHGQVSQAVGHL